MHSSKDKRATCAAALKRVISYVISSLRCRTCPEVFAHWASNVQGTMSTYYIDSAGQFQETKCSKCSEWRFAGRGSFGNARYHSPKASIPGVIRVIQHHIAERTASQNKHHCLCVCCMLTRFQGRSPPPAQARSPPRSDALVTWARRAKMMKQEVADCNYAAAWSWCWATLIPRTVSYSCDSCVAQLALLSMPPLTVEYVKHATGEFDEAACWKNDPSGMLQVVAAVAGECLPGNPPQPLAGSKRDVSAGCSIAFQIALRLDHKD